MTASAIELEVNYRALHDQHLKTSTYLSYLADNSKEGLILFDENDHITHANAAAQKLMQLDAAEFLNLPAKNVFSNFQLAKHQLSRGQAFSELVVQNRDQGLEVQFQPLAPPAGYESVGLIGRLRKKSRPKESAAEARYTFKDFIHRSPVIVDLLQKARHAAASAHTILIEAESGTGKEVLSQAIHQASPRRDGPFIALNCAALPRELLQSELFGYEGGAFTGAARGGSAGRFEQADGGTLFLDEIGDMPLEAQANLLRVLQEKYVVRVGGHRPRPLDVRIIAATNRNLSAEVEAGRFRSDLFYRLAIIRLNIPPLRERPLDIRPLLDHYLKTYDCRSGGKLELPPSVLSALESYHWPGNAREMENIVISLINQSLDHNLTQADLPPQLKEARTHRPENLLEMVDNLETVERRAIAAVLNQCVGNISGAARSLGITRATLYRKMKKYSMQS